MSPATTEWLSRVLSPRDPAAFLEHYLAREYFHVARNSPGYYADFFGVGDIETILQSEHLPAAFVNVVKDGTKYPLEEWSTLATSARGEHRVAIPERLLELYADGATLILNQADSTVPSLNAVCRNLSLEMGFRTWANVYITPRGAAGFSRHSDDHEVVILQITGSKRWLLHPADAPAVETGLQAGHLLYVPRGLPHCAQTQEEDSIHVTVGMRPSYAYELIGELAALAADDNEFQQPMPPRFADEGTKEAFQEVFQCRLQGLIARTAPSQLLERRFQSLVDTQARGWPGRFSDIRFLRDISPETVVCMRPGILADVRRHGKSLIVAFARKKLEVPAFLEGGLDKVMSGNAFAVNDIEGLIGSSGKVKFVAAFVRAGLLRIVSI